MNKILSIDLWLTLILVISCSPAEQPHSADHNQAILTIEADTILDQSNNVVGNNESLDQELNQRTDMNSIAPLSNDMRVTSNDMRVTSNDMTTTANDMTTTANDMTTTANDMTTTANDMQTYINIDMLGNVTESSDMNIEGPTPESLLPTTWVMFSSNPVLFPTISAQSQGLDNIYAPDILYHQNQWWMWYGAQGADGKDAIFLAWSDDLVRWSKHGGINPIPVVDHGNSNHVNDPTVVLVNSIFYMYYTEAPIGEEDEIHLATSNDGINWQKQGAVINVGPANSWESDRVGRPSVLYEDGEFRMWYDGQIFNVARHIGYATSLDGFAWAKHPSNPIVMHEGAIDVERLGSGYSMLTEAHGGTKYYTSQDRLTWQAHNFMIELSGEDYDQFGQVTPHLLVHDGVVKALFFGGASHTCWCKNRIAVAFPAGMEVPTNQGCEGCLQGFDTCAHACQASGFSNGVCGEPGSSNPSVCCACN